MRFRAQAHRARGRGAVILAALTVSTRRATIVIIVLFGSLASACAAAPASGGTPADRAPASLASTTPATTAAPVTGASPVPRAADLMGGLHVGHTASRLPDGRVLVAGGWEAYGAETYDPAAGTWAETTSMVANRDGHTATVLRDGRVLVIGGAATDMAPAHQSAERYDAASDTWTATASMSTSRAHHTATLLADGRVLVAGGSRYITAGAPQALVELYDPTLDQWTTVADMNEARSHHTATLLESGLVLLAGGSLDSRGAELYDPARGTSTYTGMMANDREGHAAVLLGDGRVLIVGGQVMLSSNSTTNTSSAEVYDAASGSWARSGGWSLMSEPAVALLPTGSVLISESRSVRLYDPDDGTWATALDLNERWYGYSATVLSDGTVLMAGGWNGKDRIGSPFERYVAHDPVGRRTQP